MKHPERDFRKHHYWHVQNFRSDKKLSRSVFQRAMKSVPKEFLDDPKRIGLLKSEVLYHASDKLCSGREGHCFGMSVAAVRDWHEKKGEVCGVKAVTPKVKEEILHLHLRQMEGDYLHYALGKFFRNRLFASEENMAWIARLIDKEGCALVNLVNIRELAGHTIVAYDYRKDPKTHSYILYVADSNHPWKQSEVGPDEKVTHPSYIRLIKTEQGKTKAALYYKKKCDKTYDLIFGVPYKYIK